MFDFLYLNSSTCMCIILLSGDRCVGLPVSVRVPVYFDNKSMFYLKEHMFNSQCRSMTKLLAVTVLG